MVSKFLFFKTKPQKIYTCPLTILTHSSVLIFCFLIEFCYFSRHPVFVLLHANILGTSSITLQPLLRKDKKILQQNCCQVHFICSHMHTRTKHMQHTKQHKYCIQRSNVQTPNWKISQKNVHLIFFPPFSISLMRNKNNNYILLY